MALQAMLAQLFPPSGEPPARDLDYVELFAGDRSVSRGMDLLGFVGRSIDMRFDAAHDFLTPRGFLLVLSLVVRLRPHGLLFAAPPCSTWVFMSSSSTGRDLVSQGDEMNFYVRSQNALVERLLLISALVRARGGVFLWEQPASSCMFRYQPVASFAADCPDVQELKLQMGSFGLLAEKDTVLWGNAPPRCQAATQAWPA